MSLGRVCQEELCGYGLGCIKARPDGPTNPNLPPGNVDAKADAAQAGATNREMRRPFTASLKAFFMSETTQIHPDKVRAYLGTDYRLGHTNQDIAFNIGRRTFSASFQEQEDH